LAPILISFSRKLISDHGSAVFGIMAARQRLAADILRALSPTPERIGEPLALGAAVSPQPDLRARPEQPSYY
jgi:hypothetical protein